MRGLGIPFKNASSCPRLLEQVKNASRSPSALSQGVPALCRFILSFLGGFVLDCCRPGTLHTRSIFSLDGTHQDLCRRCFAASGIRRSHHNSSSTPGRCTPVGRSRHPFVQGEAAIDPPEWKPAEPPDGGRGRAGRGGGGIAGRADSAAAGVLSLQVRLSRVSVGCGDTCRTSCNTANTLCQKTGYLTVAQ